MKRNNWSEEETILTFYYYCQIPFGKIHKTNLEIIRIAGLIGRTPSSVVFKMGNLAHFDPEQQKRNVRGLSNASKLDRIVVDAFNNDWETLTFRAREIEARLSACKVTSNANTESIVLPEGATREQLVKTRINQDFFRNAVLTSYHGSCCITGISVPALLVASHIKPWKTCDSKTERTNPGNGLCLNALHDKAFDQGLLTVLPDYTIRISSTLLTTKDLGSKWLTSYNCSKITLPSKFYPKREFLEYHNDMVFKP